MILRVAESILEPKSIQNPCISKNTMRICPAVYKVEAKRHQTLEKWAARKQDGAQGDPEGDPREPKRDEKDPPRSAEGALKGPSSPKESQKGGPESPKRSKRHPREPQMSPKEDRSEPKWSARRRKGEVKGTKAAPWRATRDTWWKLREAKGIERCESTCFLRIISFTQGKLMFLSQSSCFRESWGV